MTFIRINQVEEKYLERLSDITMETFAQVCLPKCVQVQVQVIWLSPSSTSSSISSSITEKVCALSRASRSYVVGHLHAEHEVSDKVSLGQQEYHICSGESGDTLHPRVPPASEGKCLEVRQSRQGLGEQVTYP